jgi:hypothetical protein
MEYRKLGREGEQVTSAEHLRKENNNGRNID